MRMPRSVRIRHRTYEIVAWDDKAADAVAAHGECSSDPPVIRIRRTLTRPDRAETMLHEIFHACWHHLPEKADEETAVTILAENFAQVWRDNPQMVDWISSCLTPTK